MNGYGTVKPVEIILRRGWRKREKNGGDEPNGYIWKCHSETPCITIIY
jgi:hypothetical protein